MSGRTHAPKALRVPAREECLSLYTVKRSKKTNPAVLSRALQTDTIHSVLAVSHHYATALRARNVSPLWR
jgi:hypothetical protein